MLCRRTSCGSCYIMTQGAGSNWSIGSGTKKKSVSIVKEPLLKLNEISHFFAIYKSLFETDVFALSLFSIHSFNLHSFRVNGNLAADIFYLLVTWCSFNVPAEKKVSNKRQVKASHDSIIFVISPLSSIAAKIHSLVRQRLWMGEQSEVCLP